MNADELVKLAEGDLLAEWLRLGRKVLDTYYPGAEYGLLLIHLGADLPDVTLPVPPRPGPAESDGPSPAPASGR